MRHSSAMVALLVIGTCSAGLFAGSSDLELLGDRTFERASSVGGEANALDARIIVGASYEDPDFRLWDDQLFTEDDAGATFTLTAKGDDFDGAVALLTDDEFTWTGLEWDVFGTAGSHSGLMACAEIACFEGDPGITCIDFAGSTIEAITLTIDEISFVFDGDRTDFSFRITLRFLGTLPCLGDVDHDGRVDFVDITEVLDDFGGVAACPTDVNGDGVVDVVDLLIVLGGYGCQQPTPESG